MARAAKKSKTELSMEEKLVQALVPKEEQPYTVPDNWCWVYFGFITINHDNKRVPLSAKDRLALDKIYDYYGASGIIDKVDDYIFDKELLLIGEDGANLISRSTDIAFLATGKYWVNNHAHVVDTKLCSRKFLCNYINSIDLAPFVTGSAQPKLTQNKLNSIQVPLPPVAEQQRIVDRIESLFAKLDEAKEKAEAVVDGYEDRKAAILHKAFTGELTETWRLQNNPPEASLYLEQIKQSDKFISRKDFKYWINDNLPHGWAESKIGNLLYFAGRIGWKGLKAEEYTEEGPLLLSVYNLNDGDEVTYNRVYHITEERYEESPEIMVQMGDVLLTKDGAGIGKLGYVNNLPQRATINSSLLLIRPANAAVPKYIYYTLLGPNLQRIVKERITGSATPHLFQRDIKEFVIPVPSIEEQEKIVALLDDILSKMQISKEAAEQVIEQVDEIKKAILARAFRGELGTNDPSDESAEELLKQILQES